jgi:hypothetical protein
MVLFYIRDSRIANGAHLIETEQNTADCRLQPWSSIYRSNFSDLSGNLSPHGGIVGIRRNLCFRHAKGLAKGHVRATVAPVDYGFRSRR